MRQHKIYLTMISPDDYNSVDRSSDFVATPLCRRANASIAASARNGDRAPSLQQENAFAKN